MSKNKTLKTVIICVICAATLISGCVETTTTDEYGTSTYNVLTEETVLDVDYYEGGLHFTGTAVHDGEEIVRTNCNVDGYIDGNHVTGTMSVVGGEEMCHDLYMKVDKYQSDGSHTTGYITFKGCGDDIEWYRCLTATKDGYKTQYLNGYDDAEWRCN